MKLKKLLKVLAYRQPIRVVAVSGNVTRHDNVQYWDEYYKPLYESLAEFKVKNVRHVHDLEQPENQDYIEITLIGGNDNDTH